MKMEAKGTLDELLANLNALHVDITAVQLTGISETRETANSAYRMKLALRRAESVKAYLSAKGVSQVLISTDTKPPETDGSSAAERAQNRRVKVEVVAGRGT